MCLVLLTQHNASIYFQRNICFLPLLEFIITIIATAKPDYISGPYSLTQLCLSIFMILFCQVFSAKAFLSCLLRSEQIEK